MNTSISRIINDSAFVATPNYKSKGYHFTHTWKTLSFRQRCANKTSLTSLLTCISGTKKAVPFDRQA